MRPSLSSASFSKQPWIIAALLVATALLAGCGSLRFAYRHGPDVAYWWLDGYLDFDRTQSGAAQASIDDWFRWHRGTQLPVYAALLGRARAQVAGPVTAAETCKWVDEITAEARTAAERALPSAAALALRSTDRQAQALAKKQTRNNEKFSDDYLQATPQKRLQANARRTVERAEMLYGKLDAAQRERITQAVAASPFDAAVWLAERRQRQEELLRTVRELGGGGATQAQAEAALRKLLDNAFVSPREGYRSYQARLTAYNCAMAADIHNATSAKQREVAAERLKGWETDLRTLAAEPPAS